MQSATIAGLPFLSKQGRSSPIDMGRCHPSVSFPDSSSIVFRFVGSEMRSCIQMLMNTLVSSFMEPLILLSLLLEMFRTDDDDPLLSFFSSFVLITIEGSGVMTTPPSSDTSVLRGRGSRLPGSKMLPALALAVDW